MPNGTLIFFSVVAKTHRQDYFCGASSNRAAATADVWADGDGNQPKGGVVSLYGHSRQRSWAGGNVLPT